MKSTENLSLGSFSTNWVIALQNPLYQRLCKFYAFLESQQSWVSPKNFLKINLYHSSIMLFIQLIDLIQLFPSLIVEKSDSWTSIKVNKKAKKLPFIRPLKRFDRDKIRKGRTFVERFDCMLSYLDNQDYAVYLSDIVKMIQVNIRSLYVYISIFNLVKLKPKLIVKHNNQIIHPSIFEFKKRMQILLKLRIIESWIAHIASIESPAL